MYSDPEPSAFADASTMVANAADAPATDASKAAEEDTQVVNYDAQIHDLQTQIATLQHQLRHLKSEQRAKTAQSTVKHDAAALARFEEQLCRSATHLSLVGPGVASHHLYDAYNVGIHRYPLAGRAVSEDTYVIHGFQPPSSPLEQTLYSFLQASDLRISAETPVQVKYDLDPDARVSYRLEGQNRTVPHHIVVHGKEAWVLVYYHTRLLA